MLRGLLEKLGRTEQAYLVYYDVHAIYYNSVIRAAELHYLINGVRAMVRLDEIADVRVISKQHITSLIASGKGTDITMDPPAKKAEVYLNTIFVVE